MIAVTGNSAWEATSSMETTPGTLGEIALLVGGEINGPAGFPVNRIQALASAGPDEISFAVGPRFREEVRASRAGALMLPKDWPDPLDRPTVLVEDPYLAYAILATAFSRKPFVALGVSPKAHIGKGCSIHQDVSVYPGVYVGNRVRIGPGVTLHPGVYCGCDVCIEEGTTLHPNVVVYDDCRIGKRVTVHSGTVIGSDGFGYAHKGKVHIKIPQTGIVVLEDDVEIGANCAIDRAAFGETRIGQGTKIDNLVQVAHNVTIGPNSLIVAQVGISGSSRLGEGVVLGGQAGVLGHIELGDGVMVGAQSGVGKGVPAGTVVSGTPAIPHKLWLRVGSALRRLPDLLRDVRDLKDRINRIESGS
jgi:UDP-3-O-[3-hydroxymyristoyl] glucosamine N-acyltransferase